MYRVRGYGSHVEGRLVEFLRELDAVCVCSWCGLVTREKMDLMSCGDILCKECSREIHSRQCPVHRKTVSRAMEVQLQYNYSLASEKVRCVNVMRGCQYKGDLCDLDTHLQKSCAFHIVECARCRRGVAYKDMSAHFPTCKGASQASSSSSAAKSLLVEFANARQELDRASTSSNISGMPYELRNAVTSASEMLDRLQTQLAMLCSSISDGTLTLAPRPEQVPAMRQGSTTRFS